MSTRILAVPALSLRHLAVAAPALVLGLGVFGLLFAEEIVAAVRVWNASTAYSHCFFVIPIAAYLAWDRRHLAAGLPVVPMPVAALAALPLGLAWLAAERVGIMEGRQLVLISLVQVLLLGVLGWRLWWALSAAFLYLFFLVPFGAFLTPALQHITAGFIPVGLNMLGIPNYVDDLLIDIPEGRFFVAEACAGLRFLIASIAFGVLYASLIYRSPAKRAAFIAASMVIPVIANGFRALGIVVLGHVLGSAEAAAADHILYGWMFFSIVILLLVLAGMPFREDTAPRLPAIGPPPASPARSPVFAGLAVAALSAAGPAAAALLDHAVGSTPSLAGLAAPAGCADAPADARDPVQPGVVTRRFVCQENGFVVSVAAFAPGINPGRILGAIRQATAEGLAEEAETSTLTVPNLEPSSWRLVSTSEPYRMTAAALWVDGVPSGLGISMRLHQARNNLVGASHAPVLVTVSMQQTRAANDPEERQRAREAMQRFLDSQRPL
ncbi:MAG TPA: exosortase A, partial [Acetobacteraceae bacterium]